MNIEYRINEPVSTDQYIVLLKSSGLDARRPMDDRKCLEGMISNSNLVVSAWYNDEMVGVARSMTDFHYACYLSDLAVNRDYQRTGIGRQLQAITRDQLGPKCKLILIAAPEANSYYGNLGYVNNRRCWVLEHKSGIFN